MTPHDPLYGRARTRDPETSLDAAATATRGPKGHVIRMTLMGLLRTGGPGSDDELYSRYASLADMGRVPSASPQAVRTERSRLRTAGRVKDSGSRVPTRWGRSAVVWAAQTEEKAPLERELDGAMNRNTDHQESERPR